MFLYFLVSNHLPGPSWPLLPSTAHERDKRQGKEGKRERDREEMCVLLRANSGLGGQKEASGRVHPGGEEVKGSGTDDG